MKNFVISLKEKNDKRREHINNEFSGKGIAFSFFDAVTPATNEIYLSKFNLSNKNTEISEVEISCFLSHVCLWQKVIDEKIPAAAIFEDDIYLGKDSEYLLTDYSWVPEDAHILKTEKFHSHIPSMEQQKKIAHGFKKFRLKAEHLGCAGYIITYAGAKFLMEKIKKSELKYPVDREVFEFYLGDKNYYAYQINPALCIQDFIINKNKNTFSSALSTDRSIFQDRFRRKRKVALHKVIVREIIRPIRKMTNKILNRKIIFKS